MTTRAAIGLAAALAFAGAGLPAHAVGPLDEKGEVRAGGGQWADAVAGQNPMTADEAAAALAFFLRCDESGNASVKDQNLPAFQADIVAGGNEASDFRKGGKHHHLVRERMMEWRDYDDLAMVFLCVINPYLQESWYQQSQ